jgi:hypothetical protein
MSEPRSTNPSAPNKSSRARKRPKAKRAEAPAFSEVAESESATTPAPDVELSLSRIDRDSMIRKAAYYRAERRNFESGHALEDWLAAESEIDAALLEGGLRS